MEAAAAPAARTVAEAGLRVSKDATQRDYPEERNQDASSDQTGRKILVDGKQGLLHICS